MAAESESLEKRSKGNESQLLHFGKCIASVGLQSTSA